MNHAREAECDVEIACTRDGTILGLRGHAYVDVGAYMRTNGAVGARNVAQFMSGPYRIQNIDIDVALQLTNKTPVGTYRGPGRFETDFFRERLFDMVAKDLGIDRVEFRRRNLVAAGGDALSDRHHHAVREQGRVRQRRLSRHARSLPRGDQMGGEVEAAGKLIDGRYHGIAVGCFIEGGAAGPKESARIVLEPDGRYSVYVGSSAIGQGLETAFAQIAADALEVPMDRIRGVFHGTHLLRERRLRRLSLALGGDGRLGHARLRRTSCARRSAPRPRSGSAASRPRSRSWKAAKAVGPGGKSRRLGGAIDAKASRPKAPSSTRSTPIRYGAHAAHVAVDPKLGHVELIDYVVVEDCGRDHQSADACTDRPSARRCRASAAPSWSISSTTSRASC